MALLAGLAGLAISWVVGMRNKSSRVVARQRRLNRDVLNPKQMPTAGSEGASAAVIRHTGRRSGRTYETPVGVSRTDTGFTIALMYGAHSDWVRNVVAAGTATLVHEGVPHTVERPKILPLDAATDDFPAREVRLFRLFGVDDVLRLSVAPAG